MTKLRTSLALAALAASLTPKVMLAQGPPTCSLGNLIMKGTYMVSSTGTVTGVGPTAGVSLFTYNGDGTGTMVFGTHSMNGASGTSSNVPASYTVNSDCTGSKTVVTSHFNFVITPDGSTITFIRTDSGVTVIGTGVRLGR